MENIADESTKCDFFGKIYVNKRIEVADEIYNKMDKKTIGWMFYHDSFLNEFFTTDNGRSRGH